MPNNNVPGEGTGVSGVSATNIASYHHFRCDLLLHYSYHGTSSDRPVTEKSELVKAQLKRGNDWEARLFTWLDDQNLLIRVSSAVLDATDIQSVIETVDMDHFYIAGLQFYPPIEAFKREYERNGTQMPQFSVAKPDLLEIKRSEDGSTFWQILDVKSSSNIKTSHHAQIYFYHRCMEHLLSDSHFVSMGTASIWLLNPSVAGTIDLSFDDIRSYSTSVLLPIFDKLIFRQLPAILARDHRDIKWHYNPLCRGCTHENTCQTRTIQNHELGAMANVSIEDAEILRTILELGRSTILSERLSDIEDLGSLVHSERSLMRLRNTHPSAVRRAQRILALPTMASSKIRNSPIIEAALSGSVQIIPRRSYTMPKSEDIAIIISLLDDPSTLLPVAFCISVHTSFRVRNIPTTPFGKIEHLISQLASVFEIVMGFQHKYDPPLRTQVYVFMPREREKLQRHLISAALTSNLSDTLFQERLRLCIGAICEGATLLSTAFQPLILSGALLEFLGRAGERTTVELRTCLERLGLPKNGTADVMLSRIRKEINRLKMEGNRFTSTANDAKGTERAEVGLLPRVVVLKHELQRLLAFPIPGHWDLSDVFSILCPNLAKTVKCPTDKQLFEDFIANETRRFEKSIQLRNSCIYNVIQNFRRCISSTTTRVQDLLVNEARILTSNFMDICKQDHLRKLFNMHQFEILAKLTTLWQNRIEGCPESPILEFRRSLRQSDGSYKHTFFVRSESSELSLDKGGSFYDHILTEDTTSVYGDNESLPIENLFDDIAFSNVVFPLNENMKSRWSSQPKTIQLNLWVAEVADMVQHGDSLVLALRTYGNSSFHQGNTYRFSPRLVDFNLVKILSTLLELDLQISSHSGNSFLQYPPFLHLCIDPREFSQSLGVTKQVSDMYIKTENTINALFRQLKNLSVETAQALVLKPSQRGAIRSILSRRLTVIWGPPGTGKTYTLSLSILRLLEVQSRHRESTTRIILLSAMTHAAIHACLSKLEYLRSCYRLIPDLSIEWLDNLSIEHVTSGSTHLRPDSNRTYIYAGTVFQLYSFCKRNRLQSDCVIIDEAGQLGVGLASLVLRSLKDDGRVILAGDNEQLAPIFTAEYPRVETYLFGSILDCLMRPSSQASNENTAGSFTSYFDEEPPKSLVVQLTENFRLNEDLGDFISTIYEKKFQPQKIQPKEVATSLRSIETCKLQGVLEKSAHAYLVSLSKAMLDIHQTILHPPKHKSSSERIIGHRPISLSLLRLDISKAKPNSSLSYEEHVKCEASVAASIVGLLEKAFPGESIFVATPHRIQRHAVNEALKSQSSDFIEDFNTLSLSHTSSGLAVEKSQIRVDTVEKLQGSEGAFVICLFSLPSSLARAGDVQFMLHRRRLNVAISRARTLCIMITSDTLLNPGPEVLMNSESLKGYAFLKSFEDRAWTGSLGVSIKDFQSGQISTTYASATYR